MVVKKKETTYKNYFDIHSLIAKGKENVREYILPAGPVLIRPLTDLEMEEAEALLLSGIKDPETRKFVFKSAESDEIDIEKISDIIEDTENQETDSENDIVNTNLNYVELFSSFTQFNLRIAYLAMRDFTDDFDPEELKKLNGIKGLVAEVQRISGYNKETLEQIEEFR
jgi:hypothetical protein